MTRRAAALVGLVAWVAAMAWAATWPEADARGLFVWALVAAVVVAIAVVAARVLSRALKRAVLREGP